MSSSSAGGNLSKYKRPEWTVYDLLDEWSGTTYGIAEAVFLSKMPRNQLRLFVEQYYNRLPSPSLPPGPGQIRPVFPRDRINANKWPDVPRSLRALLLYAHGVGLQNKLLQLAAYTADDPKWSVSLEEELLFLAKFRPLVEAGALTWIESVPIIPWMPEIRPVDGYGRPAMSLLDAVNTMPLEYEPDFSMLPGKDMSAVRFSLAAERVLKSGISTEDPTAFRAVVDQAIKELPSDLHSGRTTDTASYLAAQLAALELSNILHGHALNGGQVLFRYPLVRQQFEWWLSYAMELISGVELEEISKYNGFPEAIRILRESPDGLPRLQLLHAISIPAAEPPSIKEIVAMRLSEGRFESWRKELSDALSDVENCATQEQAWLDTARAMMSERLTPEASRLQSLIRHQAGISIAKDGVQSLAISLLGSSAGLLVGNKLIPTIVGGVGAVGASSAWSYLRDIHSRKSNRVALAHYVSFVNPSS
jgi:hypothetical protein